MSEIVGTIFGWVTGFAGMLVLLFPRAAIRLTNKLPEELYPGSKWLKQHPVHDRWITRAVGLFMIWISMGGLIKK